VSVTGERYGRQNVGHNSNSSNRHTALYINWCTVGTVGLTVSVTGDRYGRQNVGHYSSSSDRHTALYIYIYIYTVLHKHYFCAVQLL
jgi:hypothetical protein